MEGGQGAGIYAGAPYGLEVLLMKSTQGGSGAWGRVPACVTTVRRGCGRLPGPLTLGPEPPTPRLAVARPATERRACWLKNQNLVASQVSLPEITNGTVRAGRRQQATSATLGGLSAIGGGGAPAAAAHRAAMPLRHGTRRLGPSAQGRSRVTKLMGVNLPDWWPKLTVEWQRLGAAGG